MIPPIVLALAAFLAISAPAPSDVDAHDDDNAPPLATWMAGEHGTGEWFGARTWLDDHGVSFDGFYAAELFTDVVDDFGQKNGTTILGHIEGGITLDTEKLGLWPGGTLYALAQNNHGTGINTVVGSALPVTTLEADPFTQITELFYEQSIVDVVRLRIGKQDANRDFGTPRFGGNFINSTLGMPPTVPLPSYPTTGLGVFTSIDPSSWLTLKGGVYERDPEVGSFGVPDAFANDAGYVGTVAVDVKHTIGATKNGGTTTLGAWHQGGTITAPDGKHFGDGNDGAFFQNDERIYVDANPKHDTNGAGITFIVRAAFARPDRSAITTYAGGSIAWHALWGRDDDTCGIGVGWIALAPSSDVRRVRDESFVEAFYKLRLTHFLSFQPDVMYIAHPNGTSPDAFLAGIRMKVKL